MKSIDFSSPLSDDEYSRLADFCDEHAPLGMDGVMGLLHAVAVAPGLMPPSAWLSHALPDKNLGKARNSRDIIGFVFRCYNDVLSSIQKRMTITPEDDDEDAWELFAKGYIAGALLDPEWVRHEDRWTFAAPFAYVSGRRDLVPERLLHKMGSESSQQELLKTLRSQMASVIVATDDSFKPVRRDIAIAAAAAAQKTRTTTRVGRNEPCPCGSGKKYKKCCGAH
ncbi:MAG: SEC-C domain-containing protein [Deltaproteobacteria bacterium]|nr:SEC-C domain-containing protein [Deltaproteobacteria bacterium]